MPLLVKVDADFAPLGELEFPSLAAIFEFCEIGRKVSWNAGAVLSQAAYDIQSALITVQPAEPRSAARMQWRARRVSRHATRAAEHLHAAQKCFATLPRVALNEYQAEIQMQRNPVRTRRPFDLTGV